MAHGALPRRLDGEAAVSVACRRGSSTGGAAGLGRDRRAVYDSATTDGRPRAHLSSTLTISPSNPDLPFASREELEGAARERIRRPPRHPRSAARRRAAAPPASTARSSLPATSGSVFRDDQTYPFRVEPYFKAWVPLTQAPGSFLRLVPGQRPMLVYKQVDDYWHEPPSDPEGYWTQHFDIRIARTDAEARKLSGSGARWVAIGSAAERLARGGGAATQPADQRPAVPESPRFLPRRRRRPTSSCACAARKRMAVRGHLAVADGVQGRRHGARAASGLPRRERPARDRAAVRQHHRLERARRDAALPAPARRGADRQALAA